MLHSPKKPLFDLSLRHNAPYGLDTTGKKRIVSGSQKFRNGQLPCRNRRIHFLSHNALFYSALIILSRKPSLNFAKDSLKLSSLSEEDKYMQSEQCASSLRFRQDKSRKLTCYRKWTDWENYSSTAHKVIGERNYRSFLGEKVDKRNIAQLDKLKFCFYKDVFLQK